MASLFDIGKSGVQAYRQALTVTGQNITNINTDGYHRREASIEEVSASQGGLTAVASQIGLGARVSEIRRSFNEFITSRVYTAKADFEKSNVFYENVRDLENFLLPSDSDLGNFMGNFFGSLMEVATAPGDIPGRLVAIEEGLSLAGAFRQTAAMVEGLKMDAKSQAEASADTVNLLVDELVKVNQRLLSSGQSGQVPNSVLDNRDKLISEISESVELTVTYDQRGVATIILGGTVAGPKLVEGATSRKLGIIENQGAIQPALISAGSVTPTSQITKGSLAGFTLSYEYIGEIEKQINTLAFLFAREVNNVHENGITLDGKAGGKMFTLNDLEFGFGPTNRGNLSAELNITNIDLISPEAVEFVFNEERQSWTTNSEDSFQNLSTSASRIAADGFDLKVFGSAKNGDVITLDNVSGAAKNMSFLLKKPQELAAASPTIVTQNSLNSSDAVMEINKTTPAQFTEPPVVNAVFENGNIPINATDFLRDGVVASIPAGTQNFSINSYSQQPNVSIVLSLDDLVDANNLQIVLADGANAGTHNFALGYGVLFSNAGSSDNWTDEAEFQKALAVGVVTSDTGFTLGDLGLFPSSTSSSLNIASSSAAFTSASVTTSSKTINASVTASKDASDIQIFTREGRHIAGSPMSETEIVNFLSEENGFNPNAEYYGSYLNQELNAYRGMNLNISNVGGLETIRLGPFGSTSDAIAGYGSLPDSPTSSYTIAATISNGSSPSLTIPAGASAGFVSNKINETFNDYGLVAKTKTLVRLNNFATTGTIAFNLESENQEPLAISASVSATNVSNLVDAINNISNLTGVTAQANTNNDALTLISEDGNDIMISSLSATSPTFDGQVISSFPSHDAGRTISTVLNFNSVDATGTVDAGRFTGEVLVDSSEDFSLNVNGVTSNSSSSPMNGGLVEVESSVYGDVKTFTYLANDEVDSNFGGTDSRAFAASAAYSITLPSETNSQQYTATVNSSELATLNSQMVAQTLIDDIRSQATSISMSNNAAVALTSRPANEDSVVIEFDGDKYTLVMNNGEISVTGGEVGRVSAFYDSNNHLNIIGGGSLQASAISVASDSTVTGNSAAAGRFGISDLSAATTKFTGQSITAASQNGSFNVDFNGVSIAVTLAADGTISHTPTTTGFSASFNISSGTTGRLTLAHSLDTGPINFPTDNSLKDYGFPVSEYGVKLLNDKIQVKSSLGNMVDMTANATSLAEKSITMNNLPNEDLIVIINGSGARSISTTYDLAPPLDVFEPLSVEVISQDGQSIEIIDTETGHSIASRVLNREGQTTAAGFEINFSGEPELGDLFFLESNAEGVGDARNIDAIIKLQEKNLINANSGSFRDIFSEIVTSVGSSVRSSEINKNAAEGMRNAALEGDLSYSGVNLDEEAASLMEFQQAYQASARILSTAREMFNSLLDVI